MLKNVLCTLMVVATIGSAAIGGTFAHFSDSEESFDNYVRTGSLDLKISQESGGAHIEYDDLPWDVNGVGVPSLIFAYDIEPKISKDFVWDVHNAGQPIGDPAYLYIHFKKVMCEDVDPHEGGIVAPNGKLKPEPEIVAEFGGMVGQVEVPGVGEDFGCHGELEKYIILHLWWDEDEDGIEDPTETIHNGPLSDIICNTIYVGRLDKGQLRNMYADVRLINIDEDDLIADGILTDPGTGYGWFDENQPGMALMCWDEWPSNALMKDKITFSIL